MGLGAFNVIMYGLYFFATAYFTKEYLNRRGVSLKRMAWFRILVSSVAVAAVAAFVARYSLDSFDGATALVISMGALLACMVFALFLGFLLLPKK